jgi:hypothetical protein
MIPAIYDIHNTVILPCNDVDWIKKHVFNLQQFDVLLTLQLKSRRLGDHQAPLSRHQDDALSSDTTRAS